ncbi:MAG: FAD-linked oxidase C-terminal domain-containing protein, partial [Burkholderiales bacterium]
QLRPGSRAGATDVCVPLSRLAECIAATNEHLARATMPIALFGHVGDGNFHLVILVDPENPADLEEGQAVNTRVVMRAIGMNGTCTGEHGVGFGKMDFLETELGSALPAMRAIKRALDPQNILNPGKVVLPDGPCRTA